MRTYSSSIRDDNLLAKRAFISEKKRSQSQNYRLVIGRVTCFFCSILWIFVFLCLVALAPYHSKSLIINNNEPYKAPEIYENSSWAYKFYVKVNCLKSHQEGILYLYHTRKAAGSSLRIALQQIGRQYRSQFLETEGLTLDKNVIYAEKLTSFVTIRHPIDRILSLYWYEHVDYYITMKKLPQNCSTFSHWVDSWVDGSRFKHTTLRNYPDANYVEIENYYVKSLIGWKYTATSKAIGIEEYKLACTILEKFDVVLLTEWMKSGNQSVFLTALHPNGWTYIRSVVKGKDILKTKYSEVLMPDKVCDHQNAQYTNCNPYIDLSL